MVEPVHRVAGSGACQLAQLVLRQDEQVTLLAARVERGAVRVLDLWPLSTLVIGGGDTRRAAGHQDFVQVDLRRQEINK